MATTGPPNYTYVVSNIVFTNGSTVSGTGGRRVNIKDEIKAGDINSLREAIELMFKHEHDYTDSVGSC